VAESKPFEGLRVLVVGLGRFGGGVGVTRWLASQGADVTVTDQADAASLANSVQAVADLDVRLHLGGHDPADLDAADLVVINPAVNKTRSPLFQAVASRGITWTTETNLFCERCTAQIIGITGSFGKSTICAMLADALDAGRRTGNVKYTGVHLGGNIGRSLLPEIDLIRPTDLVVLEMSDAQLADLPHIGWAPATAVISNLHPHHLDRYDSFADYVTTKLNIIGPSDRKARKSMPNHSHCLFVGVLEAVAEAILQRRIDRSGIRLIRIRDPEAPLSLSIPGEHNQANAECAFTVCREFGVDEVAVRQALRSFRGLPHRLEHVRTVESAHYYNDSKSTSPAATIKAVQAFPEPIVIIVGGQAKPVSLTACSQVLARRCRTVICMGESGPTFAQEVRETPVMEGRGSVVEVSSLKDAVRAAFTEARPGDTILFSPGAPSFDAHANYEARGRCFVALVEELS
jgi:UDP-N-acetylmuramoylalanine--D-glutamate ligase